MVEITIIIPTHNNDGKAFTEAEFEAFEARAINLFGGISRLRGEVSGHWLERGRIYSDTSTVFVLSIGSITDGGKVGSLIEWAKAHFEQEAIYLTYLGRSEII